MDNLANKLTSRKFWVCVAAFLGSLGTGIGGLAVGNESIAITGAVCCVVSTSIYAACEAHVDGKYAEANQTINTTSKNVTANSDTAATVNKIIGGAEKKAE